MTPRRSLRRRSLPVITDMPGATSVVQLAGVPARPSISTRHMRQEPNAFSVSDAQSFGILTPISAAARMTDVPSGTVTSKPSIFTVTWASALLAGVPKSASWIKGIAIYSAADSVKTRCKIFREVAHGAHHRIGCEAAESAERTELHRLA